MMPTFSRVRFDAVFVLVSGLVTGIHAGPFPQEPIEIGYEPQYFVDDYLVDNRWGNKQKSEMVVRTRHSAVKEARNPVIAGQGGYVSVARDAESGEFKMWYQRSVTRVGSDGKNAGTEYGIAYASSEDGLEWNLPELGLLDWEGAKENNIVWKGPTGRRASGHQILTVPGADRRGHRYVMTYRTGGNDPVDSGIRVIGSQDGIHWDLESDTFIHLVHSDTCNGIVFDGNRGEYVMYCRAKDRYRRGSGEMIDVGASRRIARMSSPSLWGEWKTMPQTILNPDRLDAAENFNAFYGMPARYHAGIYWGCLWVFRFNDNIYTEMAISRDGFDFDRGLDRVPLVQLGDAEAWDDGMAFVSPDWIEVGDEWWFYYAGWDGDHGNFERTPGIGLARMGKGRLVSLDGPKGGGVVVTRLLRWPGGDLLVNADASSGEMNVRISDAKRDPVPGFDYSDRAASSVDSVEQSIRWGERSLDDLKGEIIRIEFSIRETELFGFSAKEE